ncbi:MAG: ATP-binding protein [Lachnospiraceae bacterium]|nr:ATP-binding protein [Lachnospiraceae bacterium]
MKRITVPAHTDRLDEVLTFVDEAMINTEMDAMTKNDIRICVEEIFVNIASYAYPAGEGEVTLGISCELWQTAITFADSGMAYNPLAKSDPDISLPADDRDIGGLGVFMVKKLMDEISYRYENDENILTIKKACVRHPAYS